jgi:CheY-like chemotaxis protein
VHARAATITVLHVDDDAELRRVLRHVLERSGYRVETAQDGLGGMEQLRQGRIHVVLLDIDMPVMDGRSFLAARAADPQLAVVPVVIYSASPQPASLPSGTRAWIWKGADTEDLLAALAAVSTR